MPAQLVILTKGKVQVKEKFEGKSASGLPIRT